MAIDITSLINDQQFVVTFLFTLAVVFGMLQIGKVFKNKAVIALISLALAFFASTYSPFVTTLWNYLPSITWFFVGLFFIAFVLELTRKVGGEGEDRTLTMIVTALALLVFLVIGARNVPSLEFIGQQNLLMLVGLIFMLVLFFAAYKSPIYKPSEGKGG